MRLALATAFLVSSSAALWLTPPTVATAADAYLTVTGGTLSYGGQTVVLRGENFNNEPGLSCCGGPNIDSINVDQADYSKVSGMGANMVRFGLDYQWYLSDRARFYSVVDQHVAWAGAAHLWMIPVLFMPPGGSNGGYGGQDAFWNSASNQQALISFWSDFAGHYAGSPTIAGYDIFNEPAPPSTQAWSTVAQRVTDAIGRVDPNHFVALEESSADWDLPAVSGPRILWSSHCYGAFATDGCNMPGPDPTSPDKRPFWIGEMGSTNPSVGAVQQDLAAFNQRGISWTHFVMHASDFGLYASWSAGDFLQPWQPMINIVTSAEQGSIKPGAPPPPSPSPPLHRRPRRRPRRLHRRRRPRRLHRRRRPRRLHRRCASRGRWRRPRPSGRLRPARS